MAKVGRPRNVETPEDMYNLFKEYKTYVKDNPRYKYTLNQRTGDMVAEPLEVPLSLEGFEVYIYQKKGFFIEQYFKNHRQCLRTIFTHLLIYKARNQN
jgi:hypothetical protein